MSKRPAFLPVRATYTIASLVGLPVAVIMAASDYHQHTVAHAITAAPYYYLFICQFMIISRYALVAFGIVFMSRFRWFAQRGGFAAMVVAGLALDSFMVWNFAMALDQPPAENWAIIFPVFFLPLGVSVMGLSALAGGVLWRLAARLNMASKVR